MTEYTVLQVPSKFVGLLKDAVNLQIEQMNGLLNDDTTPEEKLAEIDYGNDKWILQMIADDLDNSNLKVAGKLYQLTKTINSDCDEFLLQEFGKKLDENEALITVFLANSWEEAVSFNNHFLGFTS